MRYRPGARRLGLRLAGSDDAPRNGKPVLHRGKLCARRVVRRERRLGRWKTIAIDPAYTSSGSDRHCADPTSYRLCT
jgi:hypothetical protein